MTYNIYKPFGYKLKKIKYTLSMGFEPTSVSPHRISSPAPYQTRTTEPQPQKKELIKKKKGSKKNKKNIHT